MINVPSIDFGGGSGGPVQGGGNAPTFTTESAITSKKPVTTGQATSYASWAGIAAAKVGGGNSYLVRIDIPSMPADGSVWIALSTTKDLTGALASWNKSGFYQVVVKSNAGADMPLYLVSVNMGGVDITPTQPVVSSVEVNLYDDTYTPDPRDITPALLQSIKLADYISAVLDKHKTGVVWDHDSAASIDTDSGYSGIGVFFNNGETIDAVLNMGLDSYTACKWCDGAGVMRFTRLVDPSTQSSIGTIDTNVMLGDLIPTQDTAPALSTRMGARKNWYKFSDGDLVAPSTNFPAYVRQSLMSDFQQVMASSNPLAPAYIHARYADPAVSMFDDQNDAQAEIDRLCAIYETQRWFYEVEVALDDNDPIDLGQICNLVYPLYGLSGGKNCMVVEYQPDLIQHTANITLWG